MLGWGLFLALTAAAAMQWAGIDWLVTAACAFLLLLCFAAVWSVSSTPPTASAAAVAVTPEPVTSAAPPTEAAPKPTSAPSTGPSPAPSAEPSAESSPEPSPAAPMTRKQMRAADPTTGVLPVVSVFARKPATAGKPAAASPAAARAGVSPASKPDVPQAPAGHVRRGIDPGAAVPESRRSRRAAAAASPAAAVNPDGSAAESPRATESPTAPEAGATPGSAGESRWTRVFGPPETGQLPVQRYDAAASAVDAAAAVAAERQQRSHSSH
ncbi:hypothetical protein OL239_07660 [Arthrobacter sp. ATA002]|uniref:hypothetical protein n=1 Tax=Arthrobacter sp. ATA002 TaxID=2991715 RepID=UPI0022A7B369|nr:hypothetical protein [Arthrobacter sp. ATA002]WAP52982.1 hypothetical protein OL239_07660 [Arthrobacter sp. ATA002]